MINLVNELLPKAFVIKQDTYESIFQLGAGYFHDEFLGTSISNAWTVHDVSITGESAPLISNGSLVLSLDAAKSHTKSNSLSKYLKNSIGVAQCCLFVINGTFNLE